MIKNLYQMQPALGQAALDILRTLGLTPVAATQNNTLRTAAGTELHRVMCYRYDSQVILSAGNALPMEDYLEKIITYHAISRGRVYEHTLGYTLPFTSVNSKEHPDVEGGRYLSFESLQQAHSFAIELEEITQSVKDSIRSFTNIERYSHRDGDNIIIVIDMRPEILQQNPDTIEEKGNLFNGIEPILEYHGIDFNFSTPCREVLVVSANANELKEIIELEKRGLEIAKGLE